MPTIDYKSFRVTSGQDTKSALANMSSWIGQNPVRVLNIETLWDASGGESVYGSAVKLHEGGFRVWFETLEA